MNKRRRRREKKRRAARIEALAWKIYHRYKSAEWDDLLMMALIQKHGEMLATLAKQHKVVRDAEEAMRKMRKTVKGGRFA